MALFFAALDPGLDRSVEKRQAPSLLDSLVIFCAFFKRGRSMVLTKTELIAALQKEVGILIHLAQKLDGISTHYRPTAKQRSSLELLRYLTVMGPALVQATRSGGFDPADWQARVEKANALD